MAVNVKGMLRRRGALVALVTSIALAVALLLINLAHALLQQASWETVAQELGLTIGPFVLGVFLCLWLLLPIAAELELRFVATRALGAVLLGGVLLFVVQLVRTLMLMRIWEEPMAVGDRVVTAMATALASTAMFIVLFGVWVVLFAIFQWNWLKHHPAKFEVAGMLDV